LRLLLVSSGRRRRPAPNIRDNEFDADARAWAREGGNQEVEALFPKAS
jgi:hypothetical protein